MNAAWNEPMDRMSCPMASLAASMSTSLLRVAVPPSKTLCATSSSFLSLSSESSSPAFLRAASTMTPTASFCLSEKSFQMSSTVSSSSSSESPSSEESEPPSSACDRVSPKTATKASASSRSP